MHTSAPVSEWTRAFRRRAPGMFRKQNFSLTVMWVSWEGSWVRLQRTSSVSSRSSNSMNVRDICYSFGNPTSECPSKVWGEHSSQCKSWKCQILIFPASFPARCGHTLRLSPSDAQAQTLNWHKIPASTLAQHRWQWGPYTTTWPRASFQGAQDPSMGLSSLKNPETPPPPFTLT